MALSFFARVVVAAAVLIAGTISMSAQKPTADWPQWRGPNRDGSAPSFTPPKAWPAMLTQRWKTEVGIGYATPVVVGARVYTFARRGDNEVVAALDAATGKQIWQAEYPAPYNLVKAAASHGMGPKSTPAFADGRLFTLGISGILSAYDANTGKLLWQKPAPAVGPTFTTSQSPIVDRGVLIAHVDGNKEGGLTAFDPATGKERWVWNGDGPGYGSPIVAEIAGTRQVIVPTYQNLVGVSAETGELLWRRAHRGRSDVNAITPLVAGQNIISSSVEVGVVSVRVAKKGDQWVAEDAWLNDTASFQLSNGTIVGNALFGLSSVGSGTYVIIDTQSGKTLWAGQPRAANNVAMQKAGNLLLALENDGELLVIDGSKTTELTELRRYKVADTATWAAPAISGNRIFVKDESSVTLWTVE
jgi:outer membrane protein assembly factor BamB